MYVSYKAQLLKKILFQYQNFLVCVDIALNQSAPNKSYTSSAARSTSPSLVLLGLLDPEDKDTAILPKVTNYSLSRTTPHFKQSECSAAMPCEPEIPDHNSFSK